MNAHVVVDSSVLWYPFVALALPALIIAVLTLYDMKRHREPNCMPSDQV